MKKSKYQRINQVRSRRIFTVLACILLVIAIYLFFKASNRTNSKYYKDFSKFRMSDYIFNNVDSSSRKLKTFTGEKIVHIDLKGAPPKISYYEKLFPLLSALGATGLLIEYEDIFPYNGMLLRNLSAHNAYSRNDIRIINKLAKKHNLHIIPLVQTFGHLEFLLKLQEFRHLREASDYPQAICPSLPETLVILTDMLEQVIALHPDSKMIHIGADEVYYLGICDQCFNAMNKHNWSKHKLFLEHISAVAKKIKDKHRDLRILMWDDEFRSMTVNEIKQSQISELVEPVVWKYTKEVYEDLGPSLWDMYTKVFPIVWAASAYKGATGSNQYITDTAHHLENHRSWMMIINEYHSQLNFQGVILTGWQRYDHFSVLCELLPVAIPSLAMSLHHLMGRYDSPLNSPTEIAGILQCEQPYALIGPAFGSPKCLYPGGDILEAVLQLQELKQDYESILEDSRYKGWINDYNVANCFSNPQHVRSVLASVDAMKEELHQLSKSMTISMMEVYDNYTINEWFDTYIRPFEKQVQSLCEAKEKLLSKETWPRRPLTLGDSCSNTNL